MEEAIKKALEVVKDGGVILYPTDTVWGLGCDATNEEAIERVNQIKGRKGKEGLIILLDQDAKLNRYVKEVPDIAWDLLDATDKPLTLVLPDAMNLPKSLTSEDGSIAIRVAQDEFCKKLISKLKKPLVSTSANYSGEPAPDRYENIPESILEKVDQVVKIEPEEDSLGKPSSVIKLGIQGEVEILRE